MGSAEKFKQYNLMDNSVDLNKFVNKLYLNFIGSITFKVGKGADGTFQHDRSTVLLVENIQNSYMKVQRTELKIGVAKYIVSNSIA